MTDIDRLAEDVARSLARTRSRRGVLAAIGGILTGAAAIPVLPVARASGPVTGSGYDGVTPQTTGDPMDPGDTASCDYWRYCGTDGFICSCCGGSANTCPPGTEMSPITWIGTCRNPADRVNYIISYNDCCGKPACGRCLCNRNEGERPVTRPQLNNDINWCLGASTATYTCTTSVIVGVALPENQ